MHLPAFIPAPPATLAIFLAIVAAVLAAIIAGTHMAARRLGEPSTPPVLGTVLGLAAWLAVFTALTASGVLAPDPRRMLPYFAVANAGAVIFALSPAGKRLATGLPLAALVGFQAFRLPLEWVLHQWAEAGTIPQTMTWTGQNFDVVAGAVALVAAPLSLRSRHAARVANVVGLALLLNVMRVALLSAPLPFSWPLANPLQLPLHLPYAWIVPVCVAGALAGHVVLTRKLLER